MSAILHGGLLRCFWSRASEEATVVEARAEERAVGMGAAVRVAARAMGATAVGMAVAARVAAMVAVATVAVKAAAARVAVKVVVVTVAATAVPSPQPFWSCTAEPTPKHDGAAGQGRVALIWARKALELHASGPLRDRTGGRSAAAATAEATAEVLMYQNVEAWVAWNPR